MSWRLVNSLGAPLLLFLVLAGPPCVLDTDQIAASCILALAALPPCPVCQACPVCQPPPPVRCRSCRTQAGKTKCRRCALGEVRNDDSP